VAQLAVVLAVMAGICFASTPVSAQALARASASEAGVVVLAQAESIDQVLSNIRGWLMGILAGLATVMATVGGIRYVIADGDPGEIQRAKTAFRSAGIGFALAALAPLLVTILQGLVGL
jgi:Type IV secretion system pilin